MKLKDARASYYEYSAKASDVSRTLSLSGIAIIWVFRVDTTNGPVISDGLIAAGLFMITARGWVNRCVNVSGGCLGLLG